MLKYFFKLSMPMILSNFTGYLILPINSAMAGRFEDSKALAAVGLGNVCSFIFIISIVTGLNSGQETLTSQAFGSCNYRLCGIYLNRGAIVLLLFFVPLALVPATCAERIFLILGQDEEVSRLAHRYIAWFTPGLLFYSLFDLLKRFLAAMRITFWPMIAQVIACALHLPLCLLLVHQCNRLETVAALGLASSLTNCLLVMVTVTYCLCH